MCNEEKPKGELESNPTVSATTDERGGSIEAIRFAINNADEISTALGSVLPQFGETKRLYINRMFQIAMTTIIAFAVLIIVALFTNHDQVVRDLVIALASFLGGFATSRARGGE